MFLFSILKQVGFLPTILAAGAIAIGTTGYAGQNTFSSANNAAGQNSQAVSGYTVSAPTYNLNATTPTNIDSVVFTATGSVIPTTAKIKLNSSYKTCAVTGSSSPWTITCNNGSTLGEAVSTATTFDVLLTQ
jgi:hypothetical protein